MARTAHPQPHRARRILATAATTAALTLALAGCSGQEDTSGLPPLATATATTPAPTPTGLVLTPEQQAVADAVTRYDTVVDAMSNGAPLDMNKINKVAVDPWATTVGKNLFGFKALKQRTIGTYRKSIKSIKISGAVAEYVGCGDYRGTKVISTGPKPTVVARGSEPLLGRISLVKIHEKWFIKKICEDGRCKIR
jgi:hypothetical protein